MEPEVPVSPPPAARDAMPASAVFAALGGAALGAVIWTFVSYFTHYEIGYLAWGVGLLTGLLARQAGGRGPAMGLICAVLALGGIFAGKIYATRFTVQAQLEEAVAGSSPETLYEEILEDARLYAELDPQDDEAVLRFMVERNYTEATDPVEISLAELQTFRTINVPELESIQESPPTYDAWRRDREQRVRDFLEEELPSDLELTVEALNAIDLIFAFLGIATAWRVVNLNRRPAGP